MCWELSYDVMDNPSEANILYLNLYLERRQPHPGIFTRPMTIVVQTYYDSSYFYFLVATGQISIIDLNFQLNFPVAPTLYKLA